MRVSLRQALVWCVLGGDWIEYELERAVDFKKMLDGADPRKLVLFSNRIAAGIQRGDIPVRADLFIEKQLNHDPHVLQYAERLNDRSVLEIRISLQKN